MQTWKILYFTIPMFLLRNSKKGRIKLGRSSSSEEDFGALKGSMSQLSLKKKKIQRSPPYFPPFFSH